MCLKCKSNKASVNRLKKSCMHLYNEIVEYDLKTVKIYSKTKDPKFLNINQQLRTWISSLQRECPPTESLNMIKEIIDNYEHPIN